MLSKFVVTSSDGVYPSQWEIIAATEEDAIDEVAGRWNIPTPNLTATLKPHSNRKPFNDCLGYVASRKNALTNIHNVIYEAKEAGIDASYRYVTVCEAHSQMISTQQLKHARIDMKDASEWCSVCQQLAGK